MGRPYANTAVEPDWKKLWGVYDRWQQEDQMWYDWKTDQEKQISGSKSENYQSDVSQLAAKAAASGMRVGSQGHTTILGSVDKPTEGANIELERQIKTEKLASSKVFTDLKYLYSTGDMVHVKHGIALYDEAARYPRFSEQVTKQGLNFVSNPGFTRPNVDPNFKFDQQEFLEWGRKKFGSKQAINPYVNKESIAKIKVEKEREEKVQKQEKRAQRAASGAGRTTSSGVTVVTAEDNPWM